MQNEGSGDVVFTVEKSRRTRAILGAVVVGFGVGLDAWIRGGTSFYIIAGAATGIVMLFVFMSCLKPVGTPVLRVAGEGVLVYEPSSREPRLLPWSVISGVEHRHVGESAGRNSGDFLIFRLKALSWSFKLPAGASEPESIVAAIRSRIRPEVAAASETLDAAAFFETVFGIRIPGSARVLHEEFFPADKSGLWAVKLSREEFLKLKTEAGSLSEWFPLTRDQRFEVGGRRLVGTVDLNGAYAISRLEWESTPVLVWDAAAATLYGMLTRSM